MGIQHSSFYLWVGHCNSFHSSLMTWIPWRKDKGSANGFYPQKKFYIDDLCHMQRTHTFTEKETDVMGNDGYPSQNNVIIHSDTMKTLVICLSICVLIIIFLNWPLCMSLLLSLIILLSEARKISYLSFYDSLFFSGQVCWRSTWVEVKGQLSAGTGRAPTALFTILNVR